MGDIKAVYDSLREKHMELVGANLLPSDATESSAGETGSGSVPSLSERVELDSFSKLEELHGVDIRVTSELAQIELILAKDKSIWILSSQDKNIGKNVVLGGFGTGSWASEAEATEADATVPLNIDSDKSLIQLDESTFAQEGQGVSTLSVYKLLIRAERDKGITSHKMSFFDIARKADAAVESGQDGFEVKLKAQGPMRFKCLRDPRSAGGEERITSKNFFSKCLPMKSSDFIGHICRFRFERIGQSFKIQRPYMISTNAFSLTKDKPLRLTSAESE